MGEISRTQSSLRCTTQHVQHAVRALLGCRPFVVDADHPLASLEERKLKMQPHAMTPALRRKRTKGRRESDATFELLFDNNPLPLWIYDLETLRFLDINAVACEKYGYSREEFLALTMRYPPTRRRCAHARFRARASIGDFQFQHLAASQERRDDHLRRKYLARNRLPGATSAIRMSDRHNAQDPGRGGSSQVGGRVARA
jgi:PAS domain S-box-containing protein